jgi:hypothetical protein
LKAYVTAVLRPREQSRSTLIILVPTRNLAHGPGITRFAPLRTSIPKLLDLSRITLCQSTRGITRRYSSGTLSCFISSSPTKRACFQHPESKMSLSVEELDKTVQAFYEGRGEVVSIHGCHRCLCG